MRQTILGIAVAFCIGIAFGQSSSTGQKAAVEKHYGKICARLTTDSECRVCATDSTNHWMCYSHTIWQDIPGTALPLPEDPQASKRSTKPADSSTLPASDCDINWSTKFDQITEPKAKEGLQASLAQLDQTIAQVGGLQVFVAGWQDAEEFDKAQLAEHERAGDAQGVHVLEKIMAVNEGMIEIGQCRLSREAHGSSDDRVSHATNSSEDFELSPESEKVFDKSRDIVQAAIKAEKDKYTELLKEAKSKLSAEDFKKYERELKESQPFLDGMDDVITGVKYTKDIGKCITTGGPEGCRDIITDSASDGFSYVLKRLAPPVSEIWEGPVGWFASITLDSTSTQTPQQDFDPMTAINDPAHYSFDQREKALEMLYRSASQHPEVWNQSKLNWLYGVSEQLYNSSDNPNINLVPK